MRNAFTDHRDSRWGRTHRACLMTLMLLTGAGCGAAEPWDVTLVATSNYVLRGVSQTNSGPAIQLGATYNDPRGWYAGAWTSNVNPYPFAGDAAEVDAYTGYALGLGDDVLVRLAYTHYGYVHDPRSRSFGYNEWTTSATIADVLTASVAYQPDYVVTGDYGSVVRHPAFAYELTARCPLAHGFAATGGAGYYDLHRLYSGLGYRAGSAGVDYRAGRVTIDVRRFFTAHPAVQIFGTASADGDWAASVVYRF